MKSAIKKIITALICQLLLIAGHAQKDAAAAIQKIYAAYNTGTAISFNGSMKMYLKNNPGKIIEKMKSSYKISGTSFSCRIGPVEMLVNNKYYVSVDNAVKLVIIGYKKDLQGTGQIPVLNTGQFKTWIKEKAIDAAVISGGVVSIIALTDKRGITGYNLYRIAYDSLTGYMKKVLLETADQNDPTHKTMVLEIDYTSPVAVKKNKISFSEKKFFSLVNNRVQVTGNYKGYQLINQL